MMQIPEQPATLPRSDEPQPNGHLPSVSPRPGRQLRESAALRRHNSLLVLADGSSWSGWAEERSMAIAGPVRLVGRRVLIAEHEAMILDEHEAATLRVWLEKTGPAPRGCVTASGATLPIHEAVGRAIAAGEIGTY